MGTEENIAVVHAWVEGGWNEGKLDLVDELYTADYQPHWLPPNVPANGEGLKRWVAAFRAGMPDLHFTVDDIVAAGDKVVWRFTATGTQTGELLGIPPTGRTVAVTGMVIARFRDGKYAEDHVNFDQLGLLQQLGVIPMMEPAVPE